MNRILDLRKFVDAQRAANVDVAQMELLEMYKMSTDINGIRPQVIFGSDRAVTELTIRMYGGEPDWTQEVYLQIDPEDESTIVRAIRSVDIKGLSLFLV